MSLQLAILGLLAEGNKSGYELVREFDYTRSVIWPAPQNEIYRELSKLKKAGFIQEDEDDEGVRGRRRYAITEEGTARLQSWLQAEASDFTLRYEPVLRAVFLQQLDEAAMEERLRRDLPFYEEQLRVLRGAEEKHLRNPKEPDPRRHGRRQAIALYAALHGWILDTLGGPAGKPATKKSGRKNDSPAARPGSTRGPNNPVVKP